MSDFFSGIIAGLLVAGVFGWSYIWNADGRCIARAEAARNQYRIEEQARNGEIAIVLDDISQVNVSREIKRQAKYNYILAKLKTVAHESCIYPDALKEALIEAENIQ